MGNSDLAILWNCNLEIVYTILEIYQFGNKNTNLAILLLKNTAIDQFQNKEIKNTNLAIVWKYDNKLFPFMQLDLLHLEKNNIRGHPYTIWFSYWDFLTTPSAWVGSFIQVDMVYGKFFDTLYLPDLWMPPSVGVQAVTPNVNILVPLLAGSVKSS